MTLEERDAALKARQEVMEGERLMEEELEYLRAWEDYQQSLGLQQQGQSNRNAAQQDYRFQPNNPYLESANPYQEGVALYGMGKLHEAILAFEAALQQNGNLMDSNCWRLIGTCYAENDNDTQAIVPLLKAVAADPSNLEALLELGVSFTNELEQGQALHFLHSWLLYHPDFKHVPGDQSVTLEHMTEMFKRASTFAPKDPDVWTVLGVLYNLSRDFESAIEAFTKACTLDASNYSLHNKLGATLANSSKPDGYKNAIQAYRKALELKPNYVRSWANMGISYANQGLYAAAAKYYLKALSLNDTAEHIWGYLRFCFACMNRQDLIAKSDTRNLEMFKEEFKF